MRNKKSLIIVLIVTNNKRNINESIKSVFNQKRKPDFIYVSNESYSNNFNDTRVIILHNSFKRGLARNTMSALVQIWKRHLNDDVFIATLDDDDTWKENYLQEVEKQIKKGFNFISCFLDVYNQGIFLETYKYKKNDINVKNFILGNPGIQGSNKVFSLKIALESGGMLKQSNSSTDRCFAINLLKHPETKFGLINKSLVILNKDDERKRISNNPNRLKDIQNFYDAFAMHVNDVASINKRHKKLHNFNEVLKWKKF